MSRFSDEDDFSLKKPRLHEAAHAEEYAGLLDGKHATRQQVMTLFDFLHKGDAPRGSEVKGTSFSAGSFVHGGVVGLHNTTFKFPKSVQVVCGFIRQFSGGYPFAAFTILDQTQSDLRQDTNNDPETWNLIIPLTDFVGGGVWYESRDGLLPCPQDPQLKGDLLDVASGPQWLPAAKSKHCTLPWTGRRCVLVAFTPRFLCKLSAQDVCCLRDMGFQLKRPVQTGQSAFADLHSHLCLDECLVVELSCGAANLSWACHKLGFQVMPIVQRHLHDRHTKVRVHQLDLADPDALQSLEQLVSTEAHRVVLVWAALPHGTVSAARAKPVPQLERLNLPVPLPLRNNKRPHGLDGLRGVDKQKCETANQVYAAITKLLSVALQHGVRCVLENPVSSLYWQTDYFKALESMHGGSFVRFHQCQHGGPRPKHVQLWVSDHTFDALAATCPGSRSCIHEPWRPVLPDRAVKFASQARAEYPHVFCDRVAGMLKQACVQSGVIDRVSLADKAPLASLPAQRLTLGLQPAGARLPSLLPEYGHYLQVVVLPSASQPTPPEKAALISRRLLQWGHFQAETRRPHFGVRCDVDPCYLQPDRLVEVFTFGIPASPSEFVRKAVACGHPADFDASLDSALKVVVRENIVGDEVKLAKARLSFVAKWRSRAVALESQEQALHASLPSHVRHILKGKRLLLWKEMIQAYGLPDSDLIEDMMRGFNLSGWMPASGSFPPASKRPEFSVESLKVLADGFNANTLRKAQVRQDVDLERATWEETLAEEEQGWVWRCDAQSMQGKVVARRFGLLQNGKVRVIDDLSCCGLNATVGLKERFVLHSIDKMAAMLAYATSLGAAPGCSLCGRTYDLKSAYKQFPICLEDFELLRFMVSEPGKPDPTLFGFSSLPFGGIGSVSAFLRISACIWQIGVIGLRTLWTAFFDDFSVVSKESLKKSAAFGIESLFRLLGLTFAEEGKKAPPFSKKFTMLGLSVDLGDFAEGMIEIGHTSKRIDELSAALSDILAARCLSAKDAERLRGRMNFFEGHVYGRGPAQALRTIDHHARSGATAHALPKPVVQAVHVLKDRLRSAIPLQISAKSRLTWYLFTDGSCEASKRVGAVGAVLYDSKGSLVSAFSEKAPTSVMDRLLADSENPIYELELFPVLLALRKWQSLLQGTQIVSFVDNDAAKYALVKACSTTHVGAEIIEDIRMIELRCQMRIWYARVPTHSNPADGPSRLIVNGLEDSLVSGLSWVLSSAA